MDIFVQDGNFDEHLTIEDMAWLSERCGDDTVYEAVDIGDCSVDEYVKTARYHGSLGQEEIYQ